MGVKQGDRLRCRRFLSRGKQPGHGDVENCVKDRDLVRVAGSLLGDRPDDNREQGVPGYMRQGPVQTCGYQPVEESGEDVRSGCRCSGASQHQLRQPRVLDQL